MSDLSIKKFRGGLFLLSLLALMISISLLQELKRLDIPLRNANAPDGIISLEKALTVERANQIRQSWKDTPLFPAEQSKEVLLPKSEPKIQTALDSAVRQTRLDNWFVLSYLVTSLILICWIHAELKRENKVWLNRLGAILIAGAIAMASFDWAENLALLRVLGPEQKEPSPLLVTLSGIIAHGKFFLLEWVVGPYIALGGFWAARHTYRWFLPRLFLMRVPVLILSAFWIFCVAGIVGPSTISNLMITEKAGFTVVLMVHAVFLVGLCLFIAKTIWELAHQRSKSIEERDLPTILLSVDPDNRGRPHPAHTCLFLYLLLPLAAALIVKSRLADPEEMPFWCFFYATIAVIGGGVIGWVIWGSLHKIGGGLVRFFVPEVKEEKQTKPGKAIRGLVQRVAGPGVFQIEKTESGANQKVLEPSMRKALASGWILLILYIFFGIALNPLCPLLDQVPPLSLLIGWLMLLTIVISAIALFLDYYRVPVLITLALLGIGAYSLQKADHYFEVTKATVAPLSPVEAVTARLENAGARKKRKRVLTVICADGGGIQAAAWTAKVLHELSKDTNQDEDNPGRLFGRSIGLISSTSGGSNGAMFYLLSYPEHRNYPSPAESLEAFKSAHDSSLEEILWGFVYPDALQPISHRLHPMIDRGWAMEKAWTRQAKRILQKTIAGQPSESGQPPVSPKLPTWSDWTRRTNNGTLPAIVFNSTVVENGHQMIISTSNFEGTDLETKTLSHVYREALRESGALDPSSDLILQPKSPITAARLSATFPWISPVARARISGETGLEKGVDLPAWHLADGGYFDNSGIFAAVQWLQAILKREGPDSPINVIEKVVVIHITPFPQAYHRPPYRTTDGMPDPTGWLNAYAGPILTLANVRSSTQHSRSTLELQLLKDIQSQLKVLAQLQQDLKKDDGQDEKKQEDFIEYLQFSPESYPPNYKPPVSWHLSRQDRAWLNDSWELYATEPTTAPHSPSSEPDFTHQPYHRFLEIYSTSPESKRSQSK